MRLQWPDDAVREFTSKLGIGEPMINDWIDLQFLAKRSRCITSLIYYPFIMIALLIISRSPGFKNLQTPPTIIIAQIISVAIIIGAVVALRRSAEAKRASVIENLSNRLIAIRGSKDAELTSQLELLLNRVENLRDGAFASWSSQPIVKAFLVPLLTYAATSAAHNYTLPEL